MTIDRTAALVWRFVGLGMIVTSVPALIAIVLPTLFMLATGGDVFLAWPAALMMFVPIVAIVSGVLGMKFSKPLGVMISAGLDNPQPRADTAPQG